MATLLTNAGRAIITNLLSGLAGTVPKWIGWGTGTTAAAAADTALQTASSEARTSGTPTRTTTSVTNDTYSVAGTIVSTGTQAITEAGVFDASTVGNMFIHSVFAAINVAVNDSIAFTFTVQFT